MHIECIFSMVYLVNVPFDLFLFFLETTQKWTSSIDLEIALKRAIRRRQGVPSSSSE